MLETLGARLRQQREAQQIALETIAEQTKIKRSLLEALERDDVSHWPSGIFRRSFVRAYAKAIGLNPDDVLRDFTEAHPEPVTEAIPVPQQEQDRPAGGSSTRIGVIAESGRRLLGRLWAGASTAEEPAGAAPAPAASVPAAGPSEAVPAPTPAVDTAPHAPDLAAVARLCTELGRADKPSEVRRLLRESARVLDARGLIVWLWDEEASELKPALAHGYSAKTLSQLPAVRRDADNATAAAFRLAQISTITGRDRTSGALVVPLLTPAGCVGVLAVELQHGSEHTESTRAVVTILAAQLAQLVGSARRPGMSTVRRAPAEEPAPLLQRVADVEADDAVLH